MERINTLVWTLFIEWVGFDWVIRRSAVQVVIVTLLASNSQNEQEYKGTDSNTNDSTSTDDCTLLSAAQ